MTPLATIADCGMSAGASRDVAATHLVATSGTTNEHPNHAQDESGIEEFLFGPVLQRKVVRGRSVDRRRRTWEIQHWREERNERQFTKVVLRKGQPNPCLTTTDPPDSTR